MDNHRFVRGRFLRTLSCLALLLLARSAAADSFATSVESYTPGANTNPAFQNPNVALGMPATENGFGDVTTFASAFTSDLLVQVGGGGSLVVEFDHQVIDNPGSFAFGIDLLVFGNAFFFNPDFNGPTLALEVFSEIGDISVSQDGTTWFPITTVSADGLFPTAGYLDSSGPFADDGTLLSDFTKPVDPSIDWVGATFEELVDLYAGSGGGAGVDISPTGLPWIQFVRISVPQGGLAVVEIDAFSDVPEPHAILLLGMTLATLAFVRRSGLEPMRS